MPEGDTIFKAAVRLRDAIGGRELTEVLLPRVPGTVPAVGSTVVEVSSHGKWLVIGFDDDLLVLSHMKMTGTWTVVRPDARPVGRGRLRAWLATSAAVGMCLDAPVVQVLDRAALARHPGFNAIGPDLIQPKVDHDRIQANVLTLAPAGTAIMDVLLDQRIAAGVGNVFKSEVCFVHRLDPHIPVERVSGELRRELFLTAEEQLKRNRKTRQRTTVPGRREGTVWVYGRAGRPCRVCGTPIEVDHSGRDVRITYWCPTCQPSRLA